MKAPRSFDWIRLRRSGAWQLVMLALVTMLFPTACGSEKPLPQLGDGNGDAGVQCIDKDGDGYGTGCTLGNDCDDNDATVTNQCYACDKPRPGCSCSTEGARTSCGQVESKVGSQVTCGYGESVCQNGTWGECIINNSVTLLPGGDPKQHTQGLGSPSSCAANPCDPYCKTWPDTPGGIPTDGGVVSTDAGVSLPLGEGGVPTSSCSGGSTGSCAHSICATGAKLSSNCDASSGPQCTPKGSACGGSGQLGCCYGLTCQSGTCKEDAAGALTLLDETFASGSGWTKHGQWEIGAAQGFTKTYWSNSYGWTTARDPGSDTTPTSDNRLAGTNIGGQYSNGRNYSLVSPTIDTTQGTGPVTLTLQSWEDFEKGYDFGRIYVSTNNGSSWKKIYTTDHHGGTWKALSFDISAYRSTQFKLRFRLKSDSSITYGGWSVDDIKITTTGAATTCAAEGGSCASGGSCCSSPECSGGTCTTPPVTSCVAAICTAMPSCCNSQWDGNCVAAIPTYCPGSSCAADTSGTCVFCYADSIDHDGDGYSYAQGDCKDCDPTINPGAYDFPGDGLDQDCSGTPDDEVASCDTGLPFSTSNPDNYAKAMELCRFTSQNATGAAKTWGVISAKLVQADGVTPCSNSRQRAITPQFGGGNFPKGGASMAVYSSGTARDTNDPGYVNPSGQYASYNANTHVSPPSGFPKNAAGCPNGSAANDSCGLKVTIRAPTNAKSFSYAFDFFSSEYPEWVCTAFNDTFVALYDGALNPFADKNISFDANNNPVSVNVGFFNIPGNPTTTSHPLLNGTGFSGSCFNNYGGASYTAKGSCGGSTGWLVTSAPVKPGEEITLHYSIWDTGDHVWDSTTLLDNFQWSPNTSNISTTPTPPPPTPPQYSEGSFTRIYDGQQACPSGTQPVWGSWSWTSTTPNDSKIEFYVKTADTQAGLASAPESALQFSNPPGPSALAGQSAVARTSPTDTQNGSAVVDTTLANLNLPRHSRFMQVRARLLPSSDKLSAPTLNAWNLEASCPPAQ